MGTREYDNAIDLTKLPLLTKRRVCILADCHPSTVSRSPLKPVGRRGRSLVYKTEDVLKWIAGDAATNAIPALPTGNHGRSPSATNTDALARIREIAKGR